MGAVVFVSLPLLLLVILVGIGAYHYGKRKGVEEGQLMAAQGLGPQMISPEIGLQTPPHYSTYPPAYGAMDTPPVVAVPPSQAQPYHPPATNFTGNTPPAYFKQDQAVNH
ncbi:hypothetical protein SAY86_030341 [Trapa natans]|uniref:Uncharacterized protein n=1 Tax=Trapa natans TaxID=22666 RepID=A0AAN7M2P2_TRANT|nr:hypothetical protein SAY86_030341 [Trapa natans]